MRILDFKKQLLLLSFFTIFTLTNRVHGQVVTEEIVVLRITPDSTITVPANAEIKYEIFMQKNKLNPLTRQKKHARREPIPRFRKQRRRSHK